VPGSTIARFVEGLLGCQQGIAEPAGVAGQGDAGLDGPHAAAAELVVALAEAGGVLGQAPGDAHEGVAVLSQPLAADAAAPGQAGRLPGRWGQAGGRVQVLGGGEPGDGRLWAAKLAARTAATPGRVVRIWPAVAANSLVSWPSTAAMSARRAWWRARSRPSRWARNSASAGGASSRRQRSTQNRAVVWVSRPDARACSDRTVGGRPAKAAAAASTAWPIGSARARARAVAGRGRQARAQRLELVVEALLEDLTVGDQPASVTDRPYQGIDGVGGGWPPSALTGQPDQRRAVAVVGLVAPPAKLDSGRLGL
jgi:hypothetical protein